jgi:hypothetical protein
VALVTVFDLTAHLMLVMLVAAVVVGARSRGGAGEEIEDPDERPGPRR